MKLIQGREVLQSLLERDLKPVIYSDVSRRIYDDVMNHLRQGPHAVAWVASFTELEDDLSQWRAYTPQGGYAIGFDRLGLQQGLQRNGFHLVRCAYSEGIAFSPTVQRASLATEDPERRYPLLRQAATLFAQADERGDDTGLRGQAESIIANIVERIVDYVNLEAGAYKHPSFAGEAEWRALAVRPAETLEPAFRPAGATAVPFLKIPFGSDLPLTSIRLGPGLSSRARAGLEVVLEHHASGLGNVTIHESEAPYTGPARG